MHSKVHPSLICARGLIELIGSLLHSFQCLAGSTINIEVYSSSTCTPGTITSRIFMGTVGVCTSGSSLTNTLWISSDITSLPTSPPTSAGTFLTGYLTMFSYDDNGCTKFTSADTVKLGECVENSYRYKKTVATSSIVTTMVYSDALCQTLTSTTYEYYVVGVCSSGTIYKASSKVTTDLTVPRVTLT